MEIEQQKRARKGVFVLLFHSLKLLNSSSTAAPPAVMMPTQPTALIARLSRFDWNSLVQTKLMIRDDKSGIRGGGLVSQVTTTKKVSRSVVVAGGSGVTRGVTRERRCCTQLPSSTFPPKITAQTETHV